MERARIDLAAEIAVLADRARLRGEDEALSVSPVVELLTPRRVAREQEASRRSSRAEGEDPRSRRTQSSPHSS